MGYKLEKSFSDYLYNLLPRVYRKKDINTELKRYITTLVEAGLQESLNNTLDLSKLLDPATCPTKYLPYLFSNYGVVYEPDIDEDFQRSFLGNIAEVLRKKGTRSVIKFIAREITNFDVTVVESYKGIFRTWASEEELSKQNITQSYTFKSDQTDIKYTVGGAYRNNRIVIKLTASYDEATVFNLEKTLRYYLEKYLPAHVLFFIEVELATVSESLVLLEEGLATNGTPLPSPPPKLKKV